MRKNLALTSWIFSLLLTGSTAFAQMVGDCTFLKGKYLEVGISRNGGYGSTLPAPAGYHPGAGAVSSMWDPGASAYTPGSSGTLGFVADPAQDGWTTGTPAKFGDYFLPGTPQEGWSVQVNGVESDAWMQNCTFAGTGYTGTLSGNNISYSAVGSVLTAVWQGQTTNPLQITQTTRLDTTKLYFTVNVKIKNNSGTTANNVYYLRTLDPDNEEEQTFSYTTTNKIEYQLPNPGNKVLVSATGTTYSAFLGLGTKDCRAKCFYMNFGLSPSYNLATLYTGTGTGYTYTVGSTYTYDAGIGLVYNLGNIAAGDSVLFTYAYIMRAADLDSALDATAPSVLAGSSLLTPGHDTINACSSTSDSIALTVSNGSSYTWAWAPATGLTSTTGSSTTLVLSGVTTATTYTVIGTAVGGVCGADTFHFTVTPGISAGPGVTNLTYCQNAPAPALTAVGTNLLWYSTATGGTGSATAPVPSTATPGVYTWWVTQHVGLCTESVRVPITVTVNPQPVINAGNNGPICQYGTLYLFGADTILMPHTYAWAGPGGFVSALQNPSITNVGLSATGIYTVTVTENGCTATDTTTVLIKPTPTITSTAMTMPSACNVSDGTITLYGLTADSVYTVSYLFNGAPAYATITADALGNVTITGLHAGIYSSMFVIGSSGCPSNMVTVTMPDGAAPPPPTISSNGPICADSTLYLYASSTLSTVSYNWSGPGGFTSTMQNPVRVNIGVGGSGTYNCTITNTVTGCVSVASSISVTIKPTPTVPAFTSNSPVCDGTTLTLSATSSPAGATFSWQGPAGFTSGLDAPTISPATMANNGVYTVVATLNGCPSLPGYFTAVVHPIPAPPVPSDVSYCQFDPTVALAASGTNLLWYTAPSGGVGSNAAPVPATSVYGVVTYYVTQTVLGCESPRAPLDVTTKVKPIVEIGTPLGSICQTDTAQYMSTGPAYPGATYLWQLPEGAYFAYGSDSIAGPVGIAFDSTYLRTVSLTVTYNGCVTTSTQNMYVVPTPLLDVYVNENICVGDTVVVALASTTYSPAVGNYTWNFSGGSIITSASGTGGPYSVAWYTPGVYAVSVTAYTQQSNCPSRSMLDTVRVHAAPVATFTGGAAACNGDTIHLTATVSDPSYTYHWSPEPFFAGAGAVNAPNATAEVMFPGYIKLTVTDPFGCNATDSMLFNPAPCCIVSFPTAFTPNGDHHNDHFRPITAGHHTLNFFRVVNRWGTTVYETTTTDTDGWDGTYGGVPQDMDTYYWVIRYTCDGHETEESGSVTLIR